LKGALLQNEANVPVRCINSGGGFQFFTPTAVATNKKYADYDAVNMDSIGRRTRGIVPWSPTSAGRRCPPEQCCQPAQVGDYPAQSRPASPSQ
jgi:hypothetical protein